MGGQENQTQRGNLHYMLEGEGKEKRSFRWKTTCRNMKKGRGSEKRGQGQNRVTHPKYKKKEAKKFKVEGDGQYQ